MGWEKKYVSSVQASCGYLACQKQNTIVVHSLPSQRYGNTTHKRRNRRRFDRMGLLGLNSIGWDWMGVGWLCQ